MRTGSATIVNVKRAKLPAGTKTKRPAKYRNVRTCVDGRWFDSKREAARYQELICLQRANKIEHLKLQTEFVIEVNGHLVCKYRSDFDYFDCESGAWVVEDVKGFRTKEYQLKKKLMLAVLGIVVREV